MWRGRDFNAAFELPKLLVLVAMLYVGVRRSDEARRREFAIRAQQACRIRGRGRGRGRVRVRVRVSTKYPPLPYAIVYIRVCDPCAAGVPDRAAPALTPTLIPTLIPALAPTL